MSETDRVHAAMVAITELVYEHGSSDDRFKWDEIVEALTSED